LESPSVWEKGFVGFPWFKNGEVIRFPNNGTLTSSEIKELTQEVEGGTFGME